ncbi:VWA domain containing CoxE-like protein [Rosistilla ulvae]|uniref:VWA domain containing CoxE-like protein n=1 Tax=Rosistilla ulvae TaxID=1930277 RepID=A0A517LTA1_9BACT|nr:DUF58 domain-containing protein [Rosistilla ulvae]QDS85854.1 VWA domain containing CoxE-like protein [Rosistilla ulvae]
MSASSNDAPAQIDPSSLMRIKNLQLRAKTVVEGFYNGLHRSPFHGFSVEFSEYRPYTLGDDPRTLDWKLFARSDRYYIKRYEDETNRRCYLMVDQSKSMGFGSLDYTKADYTRTLAATLAHFLTQQRDAVGLMTFDRKVNEFIAARHRPGHMNRLLASLDQSFVGSGTDLSEPLEQLAALVSKRGLIILISDLLAPIDMLRTRLAYLRSRGHEMMILRVNDPAEIEFTLPQAAMIRDMETGKELYIDPEVAKAQYQANFKEHETQLVAICESLGIDLTQMVTNQPMDEALYQLLSLQTRRSRGPQRGGSLSAAARGAAT